MSHPPIEFLLTYRKKKGAVLRDDQPKLQYKGFFGNGPVMPPFFPRAEVLFSLSLTAADSAVEG